ncbi:hypothetical protein [Shewanella baltica]|uniref:hypothetical protein n=1 Tax=Shewanella baltica TaxID=62322 RepID=UPI00325C7A29
MKFSIFFCFILFVFSFEISSNEYDGVVVIECDVNCEPEISISNLIKVGHEFSSDNVRIIVEDAGVNIFDLSLISYLENYWIPNDGYPDEFYNNSNHKKKKGVTDHAYPMDSALDCRYDRDYNCRDWKSDIRYLDTIVELQSIMLNTTFKIEVTERLLQSENEAIRVAIVFSTYIPAGRVASFLAKFAELTLPTLFAEAAAGTAISELLTSSNWYKLNLKVGDVLIINNGSTTVIRKDGTTETIVIKGTTGSGGSGTGGAVGDPINSGSIGTSGGLCSTHNSVCTGGGCGYWKTVHPCSDVP